VKGRGGGGWSLVGWRVVVEVVGVWLGGEWWWGWLESSGDVDI
jgi:hypothetical protein